MTGGSVGIGLRPDEIIVDNFAGGGGASEGIEQALALFAPGRFVDIAINHDPEAVALHKANHPRTAHYCQSVWKADPRDVTRDRDGKQRPVGLAWFSPDCKHFSKAKGGKPVEKRIRDLAWVVVHWAKLVKPRIIMLENVEEFRDWGPLIETEDGKLIPCPARKGLTFKRWVRELKRLGYAVEHRELRACDYGAPTIRKRLFLIARCDGQPIVWPEPTHAKGGAGGLLPWRSAAACIDWSLPCPSIFDRKKPLAEATLRRIARGIRRYVIEAASPFIVRTDMASAASRNGVHDPQDPLRTQTTASAFAAVEPFIVPITHVGDDRVQPGADPLRTITTAHRGEMAVVAPHVTKFRKNATGSDMAEPAPTVTANSFIKRPGGAPPMGLVAATLVPRYGERSGQEPRCQDIEQPISTVVPTANGAQLVAAFMAQHNDGPNNQNLAGRSAEEPVSTLSSKGAQQQVVAACLSHQYTSNTAGGEGDPAKPIKTVTAGGGHAAIVAAFMQKYYSVGGQDSAIDDPMHTATTKARMGLVTVQIDGATYVITDIGMRMLSPRELYRAQGFRDSYIIDPDYNGKPLTKTAQIRMCGNSVCPPMATALVLANLGGAAAAGSEAA
jgi:DNA (cytosine-5)-methyltransferase 1